MKKTTRRALFLSFASMFLCFTMLLGTTYAWFTDSVESGVNQIVAGNLDVELYNAIGVDNGAKVDSTTKLFDKIELWEPGAVVYENLTVANEGTLALKYQLGVEIAKANGTKDLSEVLKVAVVEDGITTDDRAALLASITDWQPMKSFIEADKLEASTTSTPKTKTYGIVIYWEPSDKDNDYNMNNGKGGALELTIGVNLYATQVEAEDDSFGPDYDEDAWHEKFEVASADDLQDALNNGVQNIQLTEDITATDTIVIPAPAVNTMSDSDDAIVIDLNGKIITGTMHKNDGAVIKNEGNLILKNGTVKSTADNGGSALANSGVAVLANVVLNGAPNANGSWPSYTVNNTGVLEATNTKFTSYHGAVASYNEGALVTLNNCEIDMAGIPGFTNHGIYTYNSGAVVVNGGVYVNHAADQASTGASVINGNVTINDGTFSGRIENYYGTPVIMGGNFSVNASKYVVPGYKSENVDGKWVVSAAIKTGDDLQAAIENVKNGETILLVQDIVFTTGINGNGISVTGDKNFTLDLNGHTVTSNLGGNALRFKIGESNSVKDTQVTITIKNGKVVSESSNWCAISASSVNGNKIILNLENLDVEANKAGDFAIKSWDGAVINANDVRVKAVNAGGFYAVGGEIVIDNCVVNQAGLHTAPYMSMALAVSTNGKMTVNGGEFYATPASAADGYNQGTSHGSWCAGIMNSGGTLVINGGTFTNDNFGDNALATNARGLILADTGANVQINGGTFNAMKAILDVTNNLGDASRNPSATISGGNFSADPRVSGLHGSNLITVADGYSIVENADGSYSVK